MTTLEQGIAAGERLSARLAGLVTRLRAALLTWEGAAYLAVLGVALGLRAWDVGSRALHHDESLHAYYSWRLAFEFDYRHDPLLHGPFQFHAVGLMLKLFGDNDAVARLLPVLMGTTLVALPVFLRGRLGRLAALALAVMLAFSPTLLYFSRFVRNDIYVAVWTLGLVIASFKYLEGGRFRYLVVAAIMFSAQFVTKETSFITAAIYIAFFNGATAWEFACQSATVGNGGRGRRGLLFIAYYPVAWALAATWPLTAGMRRKAGLVTRPRVMNLLLLAGLLAGPQFVAASRVFLAAAGVDLNLTNVTRENFDLSDPSRRVVAAALIVVGIIAASTYFGLLWRGARWGWLALAFYAPYILLYTTLFSNPEGFGTGIWGSLDYWLVQHDVERGSQPWFYYLILLPVYEFLPLLFATVGVVWYAIRGDLFRRFAVFWFLAELYGLSVAGEKMPWLNVHLALPAAVLAALVGGDLWRRLAARVEGPEWRALAGVAVTAAAAMTSIAAALYVTGGLRWPLAALALAAALGGAVLTARDYARPGLVAGIAAVAAGVLLFLTARASLVASFRSADTPWDMLVYTQTSPQLLEILREIDEYGTETGQGGDVPVLVDSTDGFSWPWAWYLRNYPGTRYDNFRRDTQFTPGSILLVAASNQRMVQDYLDAYQPGRRYHHRWWFPEEYKSVDPISRDFIGSLFERSTWTAWKDFFLYRTNSVPIGYIDAVAFFPRTEPVSGPRASEDGTIEFSQPGSGRGAVFQPAAAQVGPDGTVYVADSGNGRINAYAPDGSFATSYGAAGRGTERLNQPWSLAVAPDGGVFVADTWNHRIDHFDAQGNFVASWGEPTQELGSPTDRELYGPRGIAIDADGNLWVTDTGNARVIKFNQQGEVLAIYGTRGSEPGQFDEPVGIAVAPGGEILVADTWNERLQVFDPATFEVLATIAVEEWNDRYILNKPYIAVSADRIAVTQPSLGKVLVMDRAGKTLATISTVGPDAEELNLPIGVAFTGDGRLVITDGGSHRLWIVPDPSRAPN